MSARLLTGLDVLAGDVASLRGRRVGLLANPASVTSGFVPAARALRRAGVDVRVLFGPEHGATGAAQDMESVSSGEPAAMPVVSLYGERFEDLTPSPAHLRGLDVVVCDLPDVGSRYYTFVWTTALMMKACGAAGIPVFVLDRPNPLGGLTREGNLPEERLLSFVGLYPLPVRHGLTPGEVARLSRDAFGVSCDLTVVPLRDGKGRLPRRGLLDDPRGAWVLPSPNMPTRETALVYPGLCLVEGTNLSEGRGTTRPFELVGAPWLDADASADAANALGLPGVTFRPHVFKPTFQKHAGRLCGGVQLHVTDALAFRPFETGLRLVKVLRDLAPERFRWRTETYEYRDDVPAVDLLAGTERYRELVDAGLALEDWVSTFDADLRRFATTSAGSLLYRGGALPPVLQVVGAHEAGKTTLTARLVEAFAARGLSVVSVKHTPHEYDTDVPGKDSHRHAAAGASPAYLVAGRRLARHSREAEPIGLLELLSRESAVRDGEADLVLVEGFRGACGFPKVEVVRAGLSRPCVAAEDPDVIAVYGDVTSPHPSRVPRFREGAFAALLAHLTSTCELPARGSEGGE